MPFLHLIDVALLELGVLEHCQHSIQATLEESGLQLLELFASQIQREITAALRYMLQCILFLQQLWLEAWKYISGEEHSDQSAREKLTLLLFADKILDGDHSWRALG